MKTFTFDFVGYYPVGACGVVNAASLTKAVKLVEAELEEMGLKQPLTPKNFTEWKTNRSRVKILLDGNY